MLEKFRFRTTQDNIETGRIKEKRKTGSNHIGKSVDDIPSWVWERAIDDFRLSLETFRKIYPVKTICMHGSPLSKYDNRLLWERYDYKDFGIIGEPYFDVDFSEVLYLTDTGRRWDGFDVSVRDKVAFRRRDGGKKRQRDEEKKSCSSRSSLQENFRFRSTQDIIDAAEGGLLPDRIMITVHPQRWSGSLVPWIRELVFQNCKNIVKWGVVKLND